MNKIKSLKIFSRISTFPVSYFLIILLLALVGFGCNRIQSSIGDPQQTNIQGILETEDNLKESQKDVLKKVAELLNTPDIDISQISLLPFVTELKGVDLNNDGNTEFIVVANENVDGVQISVAGLFAQARRDDPQMDNTFESIYSIVPEEGEYNTSFTRDLNADGQKETIFLSEACGAWGCDTYVDAITWDGRTPRNLTPNEVGIAQIISTEEQDLFRDVNRDGIDELFLYGGVIASPLAGYQRAFTLVYTYDPNYKKYVEKERIYDQMDDLYFLMMDAHYALKDRSYTNAITFIETALAHPEWLPDQIPENRESMNWDLVRRRILSYITFQKSVVLLTLDTKNIDEVKKMIETFLWMNANMQEENPYAGSLNFFVEKYEETKDVIYACRVYQDRVNELATQSNGTTFWFLMAVAPNQQEIIRSDEICPL